MSAPAPPAFTPWLYRGFLRYVRRALRRQFTAVRLARSSARPGAEPGAPLVVVSNHPGWWDPMLFYLLTDALLPGRRPYGPMDENALARYRVLERLGVFAVEPGTPRGARQFLRTGEAVLRAPGSVLWVTGQGSFADPRARPVALKDGVAHLLARVPEAEVAPLAIEYAFWDEPRPEALVCFGSAAETQDARRAGGARAISAALSRDLEHAMDSLADDVASRDPSRFETLALGARGHGGAYDRVRQLAAWARGRRFDAGHGGGAP